MLELRRARVVLLRLSIAFAALLGAVHSFRLLLLPAIQSTFMTDDATTSLIRRCGVLLCAVFAYWAYVRWIEKRDVRELHVAPRMIGAGALSGTLLISLCMFALYAIGVYEMTAYRGWQGGLTGVAGLIMIAALLEEITFRGLLFRILENAWGTMPALWLQSLIFAGVHIANAEDRASTAELLTTVISGVLLGAFWTLLFVHTRNLWVVAANHAAWNFTIILSGLPLSGLEDWLALAPISSVTHGSHWITGGVFGPEDSLITMTVIGICVYLLIRAARQRQRLIAAQIV